VFLVIFKMAKYNPVQKKAVIFGQKSHAFKKFVFKMIGK